MGLGLVSSGASKHTAEYSRYSRNTDNNGNGEVVLELTLFKQALGEARTGFIQASYTELTHDIPTKSHPYCYL